MKKEMIEKLDADSQRVTAEQEAWLDQQLLSEGQMQIAALVEAMPDEEPDLVWRSQLSGRLYEVAAQRRKMQRITWALRPAFGIGAAAMLAVLFVYRTPPVETVQPARVNVEAQVLSAHREAVQLATFWGSVRADEEAQSASAPATSVYQWDESDLGTL